MDNTASNITNMKERMTSTSSEKESFMEKLEPDRRALLAVRSNKIDMLRAVYENAEKLAELRAIERRRCQSGIVLTYALLLRRQRFVTYLMRVCGERLMLPHPISCNCEFCARLRVDAKAKDVYITETLKAIASPLYLYHLEDDPFIFCISLMEILQDWRRANFFSAGYKNSYQLIRRGIDRSLLVLLEMINNHEEASVLFTNPIVSSSILTSNETFSDRGELIRIQKLLDLKLTKSATCQTTQSFIDKRFEDGTLWMPQNTLAKFVVVFICYFFLTPVLFLWPHPNIKRIFSSPRFAAMLEATSIVLYISIASITSAISDLSLETTFCSRMHMSTIITDSIVLSFLIGRIFLEAYELNVVHVQHFYLTMFDVFLSLSIAFHLSGIVLRLLWISQLNPFMNSYINIQQNLCQNKTAISDASICNTTLTLTQRKFITTVLQPEMISHILAACGHFFILISVGNIFVWNKALGVLTITVSRMLKDLVRFFSLMSFMYLTFFTGFSVLYTRYLCANDSFTSTLQTSYTLFWAIFKMTTNAEYQLNNMKLSNADNILQTIGFLMYATWLVMANVVLVNLLIAMMSVTFNRVQENKDRTWLFIRTARTVKYLLLRQASDEPYIPVPWNLLWPVYLFSNFIWHAYNKSELSEDQLSDQDSSLVEEIRYERTLKTCLNRVHIDLRIDKEFKNKAKNLFDAEMEDMFT